MRLLWIEFKRCSRQPVWLVFTGIVWLLAWGFGGAFLPPLEPGGFSILQTPLVSLGDWGRLLLMLGKGPESLLGLLFVGMFTTGLLQAEFRHDVIGALPEAGKIKTVIAKALSLSAVSFLSFLCGGWGAFLHAGVREVFVASGGFYALVYLLLIWVRFFLWATISFLLFLIIRSRWVTLAVIGVLGSTIFYAIPSLLQYRPGSVAAITYRYFLTQGFVSLFSPLGIVPSITSIQAIVEISLAIAFLGGALWLRDRQLGGISLTEAKIILVIGLVLAVGSGMETVTRVESKIAPFTLAELWRGEAEFDHPYIWTADGRLIFYPGRYSVLRLPPSAPLPPWIEELAKGEKVYRYTAGIITGTNRNDPKLEKFLGTPQDLILIYPLGRTYPLELEGTVRRFRRHIQPLVKRAALWRTGEPKMFVVGPHELLSVDDVYGVSEGILIDTFIMSDMVQGSSKWWPVAWTLTASSELDGLARCYLSLYLMGGMDKNEVAKALNWLQGEAEGESIKAMTQFKQDEQEVAGGGCFFGPGFCKYAWENPEGAKHVLDYWKRGETMGHEKFIRELLEGVKRDQGGGAR